MRRSTKSFSKEFNFNGHTLDSTIFLTYENTNEVKVKVDINLPSASGENVRRTISGEDLFSAASLTTKEITNMILELIQQSSSNSEFETDLIKELDDTLSIWFKNYLTTTAVGSLMNPCCFFCFSPITPTFA